MKNIFVIEDNLEEHIPNIVFDNSEINFLLTTTNNLSKNIDKAIDPVRENTIVLIDHSIFTDSIKNSIKNIFQVNFNLINPHFLFLTSHECSVKEQDKFRVEQNYYHSLSAIKEPRSLFCFFNVVFQDIHNFRRLDNYIIHSFQTIVNSELIEQQRNKIESLYKELEIISKIDSLTKVLNRGAFFEAMEKEKSRTLRDIWRLEIINRPESMPLPDYLK
jgi:hypothetical protein